MIIADLHIHSKFAMACSKQIDFNNLEKYARIKGINLLGTGDFQHPKWNEEIKNNLEEDDNGILWSKSKFPYLWQTEISLVYTQDGKGRRIHHVVLAPGKEVANQVIDYLLSKGRIDYDGRPIFGINSIEFVENLKNISKDIEIIPAHIWTPWFGMMGSKGGFNSVEECFRDQAKNIHTLETGMSSDPEMNWRLSKLDKYNLVSFSDMHSFWPWRIGREATVFDTELKYKDIIKAIRTGDGLKETIEVDPNYGKYHFDGHRNCKIRFNPNESKKNNNLCPKCGKLLTIGVLNRVEELADREEGFKLDKGKSFKKLIPLSELISLVYGIKLLTGKGIWERYNKLIKFFDNEYNILLNVSKEKLNTVVDEQLVDAIIKNREEKLLVKPGYDGEYGEVTFDNKIQKGLGEF